MYNKPTLYRGDGDGKLLYHSQNTAPFIIMSRHTSSRSPRAPSEGYCSSYAVREGECSTGKWKITGGSVTDEGVDSLIQRLDFVPHRLDSYRISVSFHLKLSCCLISKHQKLQVQ